MSSTGLPDFIYTGAPKAASTWIYNCFADHPEIVTHDSDSLHYFDIKQHRDIAWYRDAFPETTDGQVIGEASPSYLYTQRTPERIAEVLPNVQLVFCLRNPVDRAFSQWWHGYSSNYWSYTFDEVLEQPPPYQFCIEPGFYASHLRRFNEHFDSSQINVMLFDDLVEDNHTFLQAFFNSVGVDPTYEPAQLGEKSNVARTLAPTVYKRAVRWMRVNMPDQVNATIRPVWERVRWFVEDRSPYEEGIDPDLRERLERTYASDTRKLANRLDRDLSHWFEHIEL